MYKGLLVMSPSKLIINYSSLHHIPAPASFDMIERKGACRNYHGKHSERNKYVRVGNICDGVRCRSWRVSLNILFQKITYWSTKG